MPFVKAQGMAFGAKYSQVADFVCSVFPRVNMIDMAAKQGKFLSAVRAFSVAANPYNFP